MKCEASRRFQDHEHRQGHRMSMLYERNLLGQDPRNTVHAHALWGLGLLSFWEMVPSSLLVMKHSWRKEQFYLVFLVSATPTMRLMACLPQKTPPHTASPQHLELHLGQTISWRGKTNANVRNWQCTFHSHVAATTHFRDILAAYQKILYTNSSTLAPYIIVTSHHEYKGSSSYLLAIIGFLW